MLHVILYERALGELRAASFQGFHHFLHLVALHQSDRGDRLSGAVYCRLDLHGAITAIVLHRIGNGTIERDSSMRQSLLLFLVLLQVVRLGDRLRLLYGAAFVIDDDFGEAITFGY